MKTLADEHCLTDTLRRLRSLRVDTSRQWGKMSAHQMVCHLRDSFQIATGERIASPAGGLPQRTIIKWIALYAPIRWPPDIPTRPEVDQFDGGSKPTEFAADVAALEAIVRHLAANSHTLAGRSHPIFGRLAPRTWLRWGFLHMDHHFRQFGV